MIAAVTGIWGPATLTGITPPCKPTRGPPVAVWGATPHGMPASPAGAATEAAAAPATEYPPLAPRPKAAALRAASETDVLSSRGPDCLLAIPVWVWLLSPDGRLWLLVRPTPAPPSSACT